MKKFIIPFLIVVLFSFGNQEKALESKLLEVYSIEQTTDILKDVNRKKYFHALVFNSFKIESVDKKEIINQYPVVNDFAVSEKDGSITKISSSQLIDLIKDNSFNILKLNLDRSLTETNSFRLGNSKTVFHLLSHEQINKIAKQ